MSDDKKSRTALQKNKGGRPKLNKNDPVRAGLRGELVTVNVQFPAEMVEKIDETAGDMLQTRSGLIRLAVLDFLQKKTPPTE